MTKIKWFQLRLFRTIRRQICSIDMIDIETFTNIFRLLNHVDRSIIEKYIQGYSTKFSYISKFHIIISCKLIVYIVMCFYQETN